MKILQLLRKVIPRKIQTGIRFLSIFNGAYGHSNTRYGLCLNGHGEPIPWITYSCLDFLSTLDFSDCTVFEYGSGSSTLWWSKRAREVYSVEREADWYKRIKPEIPFNARVTLCANELQYANTILNIDASFDVVVIDGAVRFPCAQAMIPKLKPLGIVILDNTEWYPNLSQFLRENGFYQVDFSGFGPINAFTSCTSIFFKDPQALSKRNIMPEWAPIGGRFLYAHDDQPLEKIDKKTLQCT